MEKVFFLGRRGGDSASEWIWRLVRRRERLEWEEGVWGLLF